MSSVFNEYFKHFPEALKGAGYLNEPQAQTVVRAFQETQEANKKYIDRKNIHDSIEKQYHEAIQHLNDRQRTWTGWFVTLLTEIGCVGKIVKVFFSLFPSIQTESNLQDQLKATLEVKQAAFETDNQQYTTELNKLETERQKYLNVATQLYLTYLNEITVLDIFGGRSNFEKLPLLNVDKRSIDSNEFPEKMAQPIMRGRDGSGSLFIAFNLKIMSNPEDEKSPKKEMPCRFLLIQDLRTGFWIRRTHIQGKEPVRKEIGCFDDDSEQGLLNSFKELIKTGKSTVKVSYNQPSITIVLEAKPLFGLAL